MAAFKGERHTTRFSPRSPRLSIQFFFLTERPNESYANLVGDPLQLFVEISAPTLRQSFQTDGALQLLTVVCLKRV
jgi:hypothetical protein